MGNIAIEHFIHKMELTDTTQNFKYLKSHNVEI